MKKLFAYFSIALFFSLSVVGQQYEFKGTVVDGKTGDPIKNVNLKIRNSPSGTATDGHGTFKLTVKELPATIEVSCLGFESISIELTKIVSSHVEISLQPAVQNLEGVVITDKKAIPVYEDRNYSVLDYELLGDNIVLLIFRYQLKKSELLLLTRWGDTLARSVLPDLPPLKLYKDPLGFIHYFSKNGNAYQCYYNEPLKQIQFIYKYTADTVLKTFATIRFRMNDRLFFLEEAPDGFSSRIGYFDNKNGKTYLQMADNGKIARDYYSDLNSFLEPKRPDDLFNAEANMRAFELFYKPRFNAQIVKTGTDRFAIFNFTNDSLQVYSSDLKLVSSSTFKFHYQQKENALTTVFIAFSGNAWKWRWNLYSDENTGKVYTDFERQGRLMLCEIDLNTGKFINECILPVLFVQKINIYKGEVFFMYKQIGEGEKWRLYKMKI
jgi:hypothetical protein